MTTSARPLRQERSAPAEAATGSAPRGDHRSRDRIEGLDGLRALAIVGVLVFHLDAAWLPGGFLGVDVFFVVSGFLITTLLVREHRRTGRVALSQFWVRRARRLLPALVLCVVTSVLIARVVSADLLVDVGRQMVGALTFSTNWLEITAGSSYFDQTAPQLFMNFWSLAVEEQFYLAVAAHHHRAARPLEPGPRRGGRGHRRRVGPAHGRCSTCPRPTPPASTTAPTPTSSASWPAPRSPSRGRALAWPASSRPRGGVGSARLAGPGRPPRARRRDGAARRAAPAHLPRRHRAGLARHGGARHGRHRPCARRLRRAHRRSSALTPPPRRDVGGCALLLHLPLALARHPARRPRQPVGARHALARADPRVVRRGHAGARRPHLPLRRGALPHARLPRRGPPGRGARHGACRCPTRRGVAAGRRGARHRRHGDRASPRPTRARRPGCSRPTRPRPTADEPSPHAGRARPARPARRPARPRRRCPRPRPAPTAQERDLHDARGQGHRRLRRLDAGRQPRRDALLLPRHPHRREVQPSLV